MTPASSASGLFSTPAYAGDFPDPSLLVDGDANIYWAYATGSGGLNLQVMSSPDLREWNGPVEALSRLPRWAASGFTWAPGVIRIGDRYLMYYSVRHASIGVQCISVATAPLPGGPFVDDSGAPLVAQIDHGGSIDPNPFVDPVSGQLVLAWKSDDNSLGRPSHIWAQEMTPDGLTFAPGSSPTVLLSASAFWQFPTIEGPTVAFYSGRYYLFYGANSYASASSAIGYATSPSLLGRYTDRSAARPWLATIGRAQGPQGPMVFAGLDGSALMAFAAWYGHVGYRNGGRRALWLAELGFGAGGRPILS